MKQPQTTRLRFVSAKNPEKVVEFFNRLGKRVEIKGSPVWDGKRWYVWFIPDDMKGDVPSVRL